MTMNLLRQIAASRLPVTFYRTDDIDQVRLLRAAGLVVALVPSPSDPSTLSGTPSAAQVLAVTQKGREELAKFNYPQASPPRWRFRMPRIKTVPRIDWGLRRAQPERNARSRLDERVEP
ncbi:hypothetical protein [Variovorax sp. 3P27G3]|jgi:hypothetical protein|uniref:hypothetical protein n=1 Tax=Variovorax sp. 3P27G3 TaxID=2502214 RepID=UPI00201D3C3F|nr:hypothetical protein [Variovorax sp. 3P27G3]